MRLHHTSKLVRAVHRHSEAGTGPRSPRLALVRHHGGNIARSWRDLDQR